MTMLAAVLVSSAMLLNRPPDRWLARQRLGMPAGPVRAPRGAAVVVMAAVPAGAMLIGISAAHVVLALTVAAVGVFGWRQWLAQRHRARRRRRRAEVSDAIGLMAAELRAGMLPQRVLTSLAPDFQFLAPAARAADLGSDVAAALRATASDLGTGLLGELSGAWLVAERSGAPLAGVLDRLEETARDDLELEREVESGLAPARATGRLMAVLPVFGLALGSGMGGDPMAVLTGTLPGVACLASGCALACSGVAWVERIAASTERET